MNVIVWSVVVVLAVLAWFAFDQGWTGPGFLLTILTLLVGIFAYNNKTNYNVS